MPRFSLTAGNPPPIDRSDITASSPSMGKGWSLPRARCGSEGEIPMLNTYSAKICCADLYSSDLARFILGESLHPGGLRATNRLGRAMGLQPGWRVLDLACGLGASATALSRVFRCHVTGLDLGADAANTSRQRALDEPIPADVAFVRGDAEVPPFRSGAFDAVVIECATSLFADKPAAIADIHRLLRPGGVLGLADVTVEPDSLPPELDGAVGMMLCLTEALPAGGYPDLLESGGFAVNERTDLSAEVLSLLADLRSRLAFWNGLDSGESLGAADWSDFPPDLLDRVEGLVKHGQIGYWLYVAHKPE